MGILDKLKVNASKLKEVANKEKLMDITKDISLKAKEEVINLNDKRRDNDNFKKAQKLYNGFRGEKVDIATQITIQKFNNNQDLLDYIIELIGNPKTPKERLLLAHVLLSSKASYRKYTLKVLESLYEDNLLDLQLLTNLCKAYIQEYNFEKAIEFSNKMLTLYPETYTFYSYKVDALIKSNKLDDALEYLQKLRKEDFYDLVKKKSFSNEQQSYYANELKQHINSLYINALEKKNKGYVYKPRNK